MAKIIICGLILGAAPTVAAAQAVSPAPAATPVQNGTAQTGAAQTGAEGDEDEIVVQGVRPRGSVEGDIKPDQTLSPADIRSYGVSSVGDLINELSPQTSSGQGRGGGPVVLLNGKRISGFQEIRDLPTEAITRTEILPEEVALKYGYPADQKVINIVLRQRFRAITGEARVGTSTEGGGESANGESSLLRIRGDNRFTVTLKANGNQGLLENQRDIVTVPSSQPFAIAGNITAVPGAASAEIDPRLSALAGTPVTVAGVPASALAGAPTLAAFVPGANNANASNLTDYRSLTARTRSYTGNIVYARTLPHGISASLNAEVERTTSRSLQGLSNASLLLPAGNPFSPFAGPVQLYRYLDQGGALAQETAGTTGHIGLTLNGEIRPWRWSSTTSYDIADTRTATDRGIDTSAIQAALLAGNPAVNPYGPFASSLLTARPNDTAHSRSSALASDLLLSGPVTRLPGGDIRANARLGVQFTDFDSSSLRSGIARSASFSRDIASGQLSVDIPIASRRTGFLSAIGDLSANANVAAQHLSDFGMLVTTGYGLHWTPVPAISVIASSARTRSAPSGSQLQNPTVVTPNVPVFDYRTGTTTFVNQISGGNPALQDDVRQVYKLGLNIRPFAEKNIILSANYVHSSIRGQIATFPTPTPAIEAAFPDRFIRDATGALISIDTRPTNFSRATDSQLRWGINASFAIKSHIQREFEAWRAGGMKPEDRPKDLDALRQAFGNRRGQGGQGQGQGQGGQGQGAQNQQGQNDTGQPPRDGVPSGDGPGEGRGFGRGPDGGPGGPGGPGGGPGGGGRGFGGGGFGGGPGGGGPGGGGGRIQFAVYHTWHFTDTILIRPGVPLIDLLDGGAIGSGGGQSRHEVEVQTGYSNNGLGARLSANWQSGTSVTGALASGADTLRFSPYATASLRLFASLGQMPQLVAKHKWLAGSRLTLAVNNLFDAKQQVRDATGATPLSYQPDYLNPAGRTVSISFRKLFF